MLWRHPGVCATRQHGEPEQRHGLWGTTVATALASPYVTAQSDGEAAVSTGLARRAHRPQTRRKRLVRKTLCCSQSTLMPAIVIGVLVYRETLGRAVYTWPSPLVLHDPHRHEPRARGTYMDPPALSRGSRVDQHASGQMQSYIRPLSEDLPWSSGPEAICASSPHHDRGLTGPVPTQGGRKPV